MFQRIGLVAIVAALVLPSTAARAAGGQRMVTHSGTCEVTVPADWKVDHHYNAADSPDFGMQVRIFTFDHTTTLAAAKKLVVGAYKPVTFFQDTAARLWYQYKPNYGNDNGYYVAVPGPGDICQLQITFANGKMPPSSVATAKAIALSLKRTR